MKDDLTFTLEKLYKTAELCLEHGLASNNKKLALLGATLATMVTVFENDDQVVFDKYCAYHENLAKTGGASA